VLVKALPGLWGPKAPGRDDVEGVFTGNDIQTIIDYILENGASMTLPQMENVAGGSSKPGEFIDTEGSIVTWNESKVWNEGLNDYQGNLWTFIRNLVDADFYETFITTIPVENEDLPRVSLVVRPKPFDEKGLEFAPVEESTGNTWEDLVTLVEGLENHEILEDAVLQESFGVSDNDLFSYYECSSQHDLLGNSQSAQDGLSYPAVDTFALTRGGIRKYQAQLQLLSADVEQKVLGDHPQDSELHTEVREFRNRLLNWYRLATYFETGSMTVVGNDDYRAGDPFKFPWMPAQLGDELGLRFYCVSTVHEWQFGGHYTTTLHLTRGHNNGLIEAATAEIEADAPGGVNPDHIAAT
jgi:hypothetical protein